MYNSWISAKIYIFSEYIDSLYKLMSNEYTLQSWSRTFVMYWSDVFSPFPLREVVQVRLGLEISQRLLFSLEKAT